MFGIWAEINGKTEIGHSFMLPPNASAVFYCGLENVSPGDSVIAFKTFGDRVGSGATQYRSFQTKVSEPSDAEH